jgi:hypothetical protein
MDRAPEKPAFGSPCNGCGLCCALEVCKVGVVVFGKDVAAPCPAMQFESGRFRCGVVQMSDALGGPGAILLRQQMGIAHGCDSSDENDV